MFFITLQGNLELRICISWKFILCLYALYKRNQIVWNWDRNSFVLNAYACMLEKLSIKKGKKLTEIRNGKGLQ